MLNLQIARAYLAGTDNGLASRAWQDAIDSLIATKLDANRHRWQTAAKDKAFAPLLAKIIVGTPGELLLQVMQRARCPPMFICAGCTIPAWT